jgi:hypothetical protein
VVGGLEIGADEERRLMMVMVMPGWDRVREPVTKLGRC